MLVACVNKSSIKKNIYIYYIIADDCCLPSVAGSVLESTLRQVGLQRSVFYLLYIYVSCL